ncbi:hypothetical protein JB92DRAFT_2970865 [Gautieria morchelliformis]|nr:hypothetical protein JB92DRAFT_2970865 [Gautieria morchelliformis]
MLATLTSLLPAALAERLDKLADDAQPAGAEGRPQSVRGTEQEAQGKKALFERDLHRRPPSPAKSNHPLNLQLPPTLRARALTLDCQTPPNHFQPMLDAVNNLTTLPPSCFGVDIGCYEYLLTWQHPWPESYIDTFRRLLLQQIATQNIAPYLHLRLSFLYHGGPIG